LNWLKASIVGLLVFGLNQNLLLSLGNSLQKEESVPMSVACACQPETCACPPSRGCDHHQEESNSAGKNWLREKQITACRPNPADQGIATTSFGYDVPILTRHLDEFNPDQSFTYIDRLSAFLSTQYYLTPPDKPPQISFV
jgi:hypothetical protein